MTRLPHNLRHFLVDIGYQAGEEFCRELLETGEFTPKLLKSFGAKAKNKKDLAAALTQRIFSDDPNENIDIDDLMLKFCQQPRQWLLVIGSGSKRAPADAGSSVDFLTEFGGTNTWYGPFRDGRTSWYVHVQRVKHCTVATDEETVLKQKIRWHVVAEVSVDYCALHWNGFSRTDKEDRAHLAPSMFEYWKYIPEIRDSLFKLLGFTGATPNLHSLVLHKLFDQYADVPGYVWRHLKIRAEREGIALNASSGAVKEISLAGLDILTSALAKGAVKALKMEKDPANMKAAQGAILRTLLHQWGAKSYEFSLDEDTEAEQDDEAYDDDFETEYEVKEPEKGQIFRGYCYFGTSSDPRRSQDGFAHVKTYFKRGGSRAALDFLLEQMD